MTFYALKPFGTMFLGRGPMRAGEHHESELYYELPTPETIYGAVRSALAAHKGVLGDIVEGKENPELGSKYKLGTLRLKGPVLFKAGKIYLPVPHFAEGNKEKNKQKNKRWLPKFRKQLIETDAGAFWLPEFEEDEEPEGRAYASPRELARLFQGEKISVENFEAKLERKLGVALTEWGTSDEGLLYTRVGVDIGGFELGLWIEGARVPDKLLVKIGGEGTPGVLRGAQEPQIPSPDPKGRFYWIYVATPGVFGSWMLPEIPGVKLKVLYPGVGRPVPITGWDMGRDRPKPLRLAVPAGSAYLVEVLEGDITQAHMRCLGDEEMAQKGFGLVLVFNAEV